MAPDIPTAKYSCGATFFPVCPTCRLLSAKPLSTAALEAPIAAPSASARGGISLSNSSFDLTPRPPDTTLLADARSGRSDFARSSDSHCTGHSDSGSDPCTTSAAPPSRASKGKAAALTVMTFVFSVHRTVRIAFPAYIGRIKAMLVRENDIYLW